MVTCVCERCGNQFDEKEIETVSYKEHSGASVQKDDVSPCCHAAYGYLD